MPNAVADVPFPPDFRKRCDMSDAPFMPMFWRDFLTDTQALSEVEFTAYTRLLGMLWLAGGWLPDDERRLARAVNMSVKKWRSVRSGIEDKLTIRNGQITQARLLSELEKVKMVSQKRSRAAQKRWDIENGNALQTNDSDDAEAYAQQTHMQINKETPPYNPPSEGMENGSGHESEIEGTAATKLGEPSGSGPIDEAERERLAAIAFIADDPPTDTGNPAGNNLTPYGIGGTDPVNLPEWGASQPSLDRYCNAAVAGFVLRQSGAIAQGSNRTGDPWAEALRRRRAARMGPGGEKV